ncbi:MAG TPA: DUF1566 domain-containing protein [Polyangiaceae bacterium]|nr:DUF1566 domain-containing protein [Polyangiaceae bacterium]
MRTLLVACGCFALLGVFGLSACGSDTPPANAAGSAGTSGSGSAGVGGLVNSSNPPPEEIAQWPMPNSAELALPNPADYDAETTPGVVHDRVTALDWLQDPGLESYTRADALDRCAGLSFAGFDDWRLPAFIELISLFNAVPNEADPLDPSYIAPVFQARGRFWAASALSESGLGRLLDFTAAGCGTSPLCSIGVAGKADELLGGAFCVRNSEPPTTSARYETDGERVTDLRTGLSWQGVPAAVQTVGHSEALSACGALGDGARLPSINELLSILVPLLDKKAFPNWPAEAFAWSSSSIPAKPDSYWVAATGGATRAELSTAHHRVQCVVR